MIFLNYSSKNSFILTDVCLRLKYNHKSKCQLKKNKILFILIKTSSPKVVHQKARALHHRYEAHLIRFLLKNTNQFHFSANYKSIYLFNIEY